MLSLVYVNTNIKFINESISLRSYTIVSSLMISKEITLIDKKKFVKSTLEKDFKEVCYIYNSSQNLINNNINLFL